MDTEGLVGTYFRVWNETDPEERRRLLELVWADDGELIDPQFGRIQGREAALERFIGFSERAPGARVSLTSGLDLHNGYLRYSWDISMPDGSLILEGLDVCELDQDGRLRRVVMFYGSLPTVAA